MEVPKFNQKGGDKMTTTAKDVNKFWESLCVQDYDLPSRIVTKQQLSKFKKEVYAVIQAYRELERSSKVKNLIKSYRLATSRDADTVIFINPKKGFITEHHSRNKEWDINSTEENKTTDRELFKFHCAGLLPDAESIAKSIY